jgi:hypothetical protein
MHYDYFTVLVVLYTYTITVRPNCELASVDWERSTNRKEQTTGTKNRGCLSAAARVRFAEFLFRFTGEGSVLWLREARRH